jgi:hypothetical protein
VRHYRLHHVAGARALRKQASARGRAEAIPVADTLEQFATSWFSNNARGLQIGRGASHPMADSNPASVLWMWLGLGA